MKKIILLAAAVVPMLAAADVVNPTGSLYSTAPGEGWANTIYLPPFASATWNNGDTPIDWQINKEQPIEDKTSITIKTPIPNWYTIKAILSENETKEIRAIFGSGANSAAVAPNYATTAELTSEGANQQINNIAPAWTNTPVGYAQLIKAAGAPYSFYCIEIEGVTPSEEISVSIYEPTKSTDGVMTLGEPVAILEPSTVNYQSDTPITVNKDLIVVITGLEKIGAKKGKTNCSGAYYAFTYNNSTETNSLALTPVPADNKNDFALDFYLRGVSYPYAAIIADQTVYQSNDTINIDFDNNVDAFSCVGYFSSNSNNNNNIEITVDGQPSWLTVTTEKKTGSAYNVNFSLPTKEHGEAWVKLSVPGATSPTFHITYEGVTGIEDVEAAATEVIAREYFDLQGRRLNEVPQSGFYIERATLANGKVTSRTLRR